LRRYKSAISDYDRAIELDPNLATAFLNRGTAKAELRRYESALRDYDRAIELDPESSLPYNAKAQVLWIGLGDMSAAHLHFNRFLYLAETTEIIKNWNPTHNFYARHAAAPFLLHRLFELLPGIGDFVSWQGTLHETERQCRTLKNYLQHLRDTGEPERDAPQFHRLDALVHYFMGDPMEAYRIYDDILDGELKCLDLMDCYYFLCSAAEFLEPDERIRRFALQQAARFLATARPIFYSSLINFSGSKQPGF
jgi:tetratricopeptide (TPR) repeat protein